MTLDDLKNRLAMLFSQGNLGMCLEEIHGPLIKDWKSDAYQAFLLLSNKYNTLKKDKNLVGIAWQEFVLRDSGLGKQFMDMVADFKPEHFDLTFSMQKEIHQTITIVANGPDALRGTLEYFDPAIFKNLEPVDIVNLTDDVRSGPTRLVILANLAEFENDPYKKQLRDYLDQETKPEALYFGGAWEALKRYPDQVYAANSKFSLVARVREMLDYLKTG